MVVSTLYRSGNNHVKCNVRILPDVFYRSHSKGEITKLLHMYIIVGRREAQEPEASESRFGTCDKE